MSVYLSLWHGVQPRKRYERILARDVLADVAQHHGMTVDAITGPSRIKRYVRARHEAMWRCREATGMGYIPLGVIFGGRDHTTVMNGCRRYEARMAAA